MFSQYFGHYLLNNGLITSVQLNHALELQKTTHVKFGVLAVDEGLLTTDQVEEIHERQRIHDKRFGEIATELGYLSNDQVDMMLSSQKKNHLLLAQAIVDQNYMTIEAFSNALTNYKKLYSLSDEKFEAIKSGDIDAMVEGLLHLKETEKQGYAQYISLFVKNMIRFIDDQVYVEAGSANGNLQTEWLVSQEIKGANPLFTAIAVDEKLFLEIASVFAEEELTEANELAQASVSEFLNLHNGIYLVNMSNKGIELDMEPQKVEKNAKISIDEGAGLPIIVHTSKGEFQLLIANQPKHITVSSGKKENQAV
ncbi:hypothetical protein BGM26_13870 [Bacillus sp. FJAT-29790]|uniref:hypothetical protein n=1 Tax=Bacillus sp. FJAT-29790 TaxID=1895002 RepID=UPI001C22ED1B|nr:hypothetical protein [Bacillus sp. FJAT-29790]MBU8880065.1 hypothetical protein [Bacillus sp. FJAT-29790]